MVQFDQDRRILQVHQTSAAVCYVKPVVVDAVVSPNY